MKKDKTIGVLGIIAYLLSVFASAENQAGESIAPTSIIVVSTMATLSFFILAFAVLWKKAKKTAVLLVVAGILFLILSGLIEIIGVENSWIIVFYNMSKVFNIIMIIAAIYKLFKK